AMAVEGALMRLAVDSACQPADDGEALGGQLEAEPLRHPAADIAGRAGANDRDTVAISRMRGTPHEQERRRIGDLAQIRGIVGVSPFDEARADVGQLTQFFLEDLEIAELSDTACGLARHAGRRDLLRIELKYFFRRAELFDQQLASARPDSARPSQCEPVNVR